MMRAADDRLKASAIVSSSIKVLLVGAQVDWRTKTSLPRTFSKISTMVSPSLKVPTVAFPIGIFK